MTDAHKGILAMIATCTIWGLSPIFYKLLTHVPAHEVLAHRAIWSLVFFAGFLMLQGRLGEIRSALASWRRVWLTVLAALMVTTNWFLFIYATQIDQVTETSLGYYIFPLLAVLIGRYWFGDRLGAAQWLAVGLAILAVTILTLGLGVVPWIALILATTFAVYGTLKTGLSVGPVVSVVCEILMLLPLWLIILVMVHASGQGTFGHNLRDSLLLIAAGPITSLPLVLFSYAARRVTMSTLGVLQYLNPTLQFFCAALIFGEVFTLWHGIAFPLIWLALTVYSFAAWRQEKASRNAPIAASGVSTHVTKSPSEASANP